MSFDDDVRPQKALPESTAKYQFDGVKPGQSLWVENHKERATAMTYFRRWQKRTGEALRAHSEEVGDSDPRGPGYRIFFERDDEAILKSSARFTMPRYDELTDDIRSMWTRRMIMDEEDYLEMLRMEPRIPRNMTELKALKAAVNQRQTVFQKMRLKEIEHESVEEPERIVTEAAPIKPAGDLPEGVTPYSELSRDDRRSLKEASIVNAAEYATAVAHEFQKPEMNAASAQYSVVNGYSDFSTKKIQDASQAQRRAAMNEAGFDAQDMGDDG